MFTSSNALSPLYKPQIVSFHVLPETRQIVVMMRGGDIAALSLDDNDYMVRLDNEITI